MFLTEFSKLETFFSLLKHSGNQIHVNPTLTLTKETADFGNRIYLLFRMNLGIKPFVLPIRLKPGQGEEAATLKTEVVSSDVAVKEGTARSRTR
jgi:hypothetical protein